METLGRVLEQGTLTEKQGALSILASLPGQEANKLIVEWLNKLTLALQVNQGNPVRSLSKPPASAMRLPSGTSSAPIAPRQPKQDRVCWLSRNALWG